MKRRHPEFFNGLPSRIPADARISVVAETQIVPATEVREKFRRVKPLKEISITQRGWTLDVLNIVRRLGKTEFTNQDVYAFAPEMEKLHPDNRHVRNPYQNRERARCQRFGEAARREEEEYPLWIFDQRATQQQRQRSATRRAVSWRAPGGVAPQSESAAAIFLRRALPCIPPENSALIPYFDMGSKDKIRQQLQVLRDTGFLVHLGHGEWQVK